jgi:hypothetical protein
VLVDERSPSALAGAIDGVLLDHARRERLAGEATARALGFTADASARKMVHALAAALVPGMRDALSRGTTAAISVAL